MAFKSIRDRLSIIDFEWLYTNKAAENIFQRRHEDLIGKHLLSEKGPIYGIDVQPGVWHGLVTLSDVCVCFEGKSGPYDPKEDKFFAAWAPTEADDARFATMEKWEKLFT
jgi:dTDP-4-dehydrorhamnose 3,5-epimerase-like enzyme